MAGNKQQTQNIGATMARLWEKGEAVDAKVHRFTVGNDPQIDLHILRWDIIGSLAQARMLAKVGLISEDESKNLVAALGELLIKADRGEVHIPDDLEDCHTTIESLLIEVVGEAGKKIHTGRSRNDQVLLAMRLYLREQVASGLAALHAFADQTSERAEELFDQPMPGYTHYQRAMPTSVGVWLHAFAEAALHLLREGFAVYEMIDCSPLGAASGFGVPLPLDRAYVAELLGFRAVQRNPIYVQSSRGRHELLVLRWMLDVNCLLEKLACDLVLFSTEEFGFVSIPPEFTTGSSIMPQKHNPDVLELLRARASRQRGAVAELEAVIAKLPSHYHRDYQYTKEPVMRGTTNFLECLDVATEVVARLGISPERIKAAMSPELFATYDAYRRVLAGETFRDAYKATAEAVKKGEINVTELESDLNIILTSAREELSDCRAELATVREQIGNLILHLTEVERRLLGGS
ncbi:MAG: argininosuccinate lyase [bacterium]|nr:argininosuccinate lyase [bacterium]